MSNPLTSQEVAQRWVAGLGGDLMRLAELASPEMRVWHSNDNQWLAADEAAARMARADPSAAFALKDVRSLATESGFVIQASVDGPAGPMHVVQILTVEGGQVAACEEYIAPEMPIPS